MIPVSPQWTRTLSHSHGVATRVDILYDGTVVAADIDFVDGTVSVDAGSDVRRDLSLTVPDPAVFPQLATDPYSPYGHRVRVQRGLRYADGNTEWVDCGFFCIESVSGDVHYGPLSISAPGLEYLVQQAPFETATTTTGSHAAWIEAQLEMADPFVSFVDESSEGTSPLPRTTYDAGADRWKALCDVATAIGAELFVDPHGTFILRDIPDPEMPAPIAWDITAGRDDSVMVSADASLSADGVYNRVIVLSENSAEGQPPISGTATITDSANPLRWDGPLGRRPLVYETDLVLSAAAAEGTARAMLRRHSGIHKTVSLTTIPNPALDAGDTIRVAYANGRDPELHIVESFDIPLSASGGASQIKTVSGRAEGS